MKQEIRVVGIPSVIALVVVMVTTLVMMGANPSAGRVLTGTDQIIESTLRVGLLVTELLVPLSFFMVVATLTVAATLLSSALSTWSDARTLFDALAVAEAARFLVNIAVTMLSGKGSTPVVESFIGGNTVSISTALGYTVLLTLIWGLIAGIGIRQFARLSLSKSTALASVLVVLRLSAGIVITAVSGT